MILTATENQGLTKNNTIKTYIILGDSTALGRATPATLALYKRRKYMRRFDWVKVWNYNTAQLEPLEWDVNNALGASAEQFGLELKLADLLKLDGKDPACFIKRAVGSSSLTPTAISTAPSSWDKATGTHYNNLITDITNACSALHSDNYGWFIEIEAIICLLGLNDTLTDAAATAWQTAATDLVNNMYTDSPYLETSKTKFIFGKPNTLANVNQTRLSTIRTAIDTIAASFSYIDAIDLDGLPLKGDMIHHNSTAEVSDLVDTDSVAHRFFAVI